MTDQKKLDEMHQRVTEWSDSICQDDTDLDYETLMADSEFHEIIGELMKQDQDSLMVLLGMSISENQETKPAWLKDLDD